MPSQQPAPPTVVVRRTPAPPAPPPPAVAPTPAPTVVNVATPTQAPPPQTIHVRPPSLPQALPRAATPVIPEIIAPPPLPPPPVVVQVPPSPAPPRHAVVQVVSGRPPDIEIDPGTPATQSEEMVPEPIHVPSPAITVPSAIVQVGMERPTPPPPLIVVRNPRPQRPGPSPQLAQSVAPPEKHRLTVITPISESGHEPIDEVPEGISPATPFQGQTPSFASVPSPESVPQALPAAPQLPALIPPPASLVEIPGSVVQNRAVVRVPNPFPAVQEQPLEAAPASPAAPLATSLPRLPTPPRVPTPSHVSATPVPAAVVQLLGERQTTAQHIRVRPRTPPVPEPSHEPVVEPEPVPTVSPREPSPPIPAPTPQWKPALVTVPSHRTPSRATARVKSRDGTTSTEPTTKPFEFRLPSQRQATTIRVHGEEPVHTPTVIQVRTPSRTATLRATGRPPTAAPTGKPVSIISEEPEHPLSWTPVPGGEDMPAQDHPGMRSPSRPSPHLSYISGAPIIHSPRPISAVVGGAVPALEQVADLQEEERTRQQEFERFVEELRNFMAQQREMMHRMVFSAATAEQVAQQAEEDHHRLSQAIQDVQTDAEEQRKSVEENIIGIVSQERTDELERERQRVRDLEAELEQLTQEMEEETGRQEEDKCEQARIEAAAHDEEIRRILGDITNRLDMANAEKDEWEGTENERRAQKDEQRNVKASQMERLEERMGRIIQEQTRSMALAQEERDRRNQQPGYAEIIEHLRQTNQRQQALLNELLNCK